MTELQITENRYLFKINNNGNDENEIIVSFSYKQDIGKWDYKSENFEIAFFQNPYFDKEVDVFELSVNNQGGQCERLGYAIPLSAIESEDNTESERSLINYKYCAFRKIIEGLVNDERYDISNEEQIISQCIPAPNTYVIIINKENNTDFNIDDFIYSFAKAGFYRLGDSSEIKKTYDKLIPDGCKKIKLNKTESSLYNDFPYVKDLIDNYLKTSDDYLARFILLYQVIELFIEKEGRKWIDECIDKFKNENVRTSSDFLDEVKNLSKESVRINRLFTNNIIDLNDSKSFEEACKSLFEKINFTPNNTDLPELLYCLRNKIVHSYRNLLQYKNELEDAIRMFEIVILDLLTVVNFDSK